MWIDDLIGAGSAPMQIPSGTLIGSGGYYVMEFSSYFNNTGDDVHLLGADGITIFDSYTYVGTIYDLSYCRQPDGGAWSVDVCIATKGMIN